MRIALINPKFRLPIDTRTTPHLGLAYLAAVSERRGDEVIIFDADVEKQSVAEFVQEFRPHLVGITANTPQVKQAWRTARAIKEVHDCLIVLGGPHVSVLPEESCEKPYVDIVVRGEGEDTWIDISDRLEAFQADQPYSTEAFMHPENEIFEDCLGITYKTSDGRIHNTIDRTPIADLDSLPWPAYHHFKMDKYTNLQPATDHVDGARSFSIMTSRGCPYRCTFCSQSIMPIKWRSRSPESVLAEWRHLVEDLGAEEIGILDDSANIRVKRLEEIGTLLIENNLNHVPWIFVNGIRANLASKELLQLLKDAGLRRTAFGVESGDPEVLKSIDKKVDHDTIRWAFKNAKEVGLETIAFLIIGLPGETRESMQRTIDFAIELDPLIANFSMMTPYPGTKVYEIIKRQGRFLINDWEDYVFFEQQARYEMGDMSAELVEEMYRKAYRQFYLRPSPIMRRLKTKDFWLNLPRNVRIATRTFVPKKEKTNLRQAVEAEGAI
ncbi:MAG: cobalamin B12-binding domain-containing protein [Caldilineaceae bacterium]|nr:cobalamin-dependent protein [Caldilineaceae bacterium]MCB9139627.1 cobalamin B12-binding domain-containing protein [Caldilineaceae bacterium]